MQGLAVNGYEAEDVRAELHRSGRTISFRYDLLDVTNVRQDIEITTFVNACRVANNSLADINRTAELAIYDTGVIDWQADRIKPWYRLLMPDGGYAEWPLGVFLLATTRRQRGGIRPVVAYDQTLVLLDDKVTTRYTVTATTNIVTAILSVLTGAGITAVDYTATTETMPVDRDWPPGTTKLRIVQDLLNMISYRSIYFNGSGRAVLVPYQRPDQRSEEYEYATDSLSLLSPDFDHELDLFSIPNIWKLVVGEPDRTVLTSEYTNDEASSPTSTITRGRNIVDYRERVEATSQDALDDLAEQLAFEASQVYESIEVHTAAMPHHEDSDLLKLTHSGADVDAKFVETQWDLECKAGSKMKHRMRRVVTV